MLSLGTLDMAGPIHGQMWESVVLSLRLAIVNGSLAPGTHLVEADLAQRLNVSRGPIREALTRLEQEGLVINYPYRGKFVADVSAEDVREIYDLRLLLESRAIRSLAHPLNGEDLNRMHNASAAMTQALSEGRNERFADLDVEFHRQLVAASKRERLLQLWNILSGVTHAFIVINARNDPQGIGHISAGHERLIDALAQYDLAAAAEILAKHLHEAEESMLAVKSKLPGSDR